MGKKVWYTLELENTIDGYKEVIAKVKSKGLTYQTKMLYQDVYKDTYYKVNIK